MNHAMSCDEVRPLLFDFKKGARGLDEKRRVYAHLAICRDCRDEERAEQALTGLLSSYTRKGTTMKMRRHSLLIAATAATVLALVFVPPLLESEPMAAGSITRYRLEPGREAAVSEVGRLGGEQLIEVPAGSYVAIDLEDAARLGVGGPATFALRYVEPAWAIDLYAGELQVEVAARGKVSFASRFGRKELGSGTHTLSATVPSTQDTPQDQGDPPAKLFQDGLDLYYRAEDMAAAEVVFRKVVADQRATPSQVEEARFYIVGCLGRQDKLAEALAAGTAFLKDYPKGSGRGLVLFFEGVYARRLGQEARARAAWERLIAEQPDSDLVTHAATQLGLTPEPRPAADSPTEDAKPRSPNMNGRLTADDAKRGGYLVVRVRLEQRDDFAKVADEIAAFHQAELIDFDGRDFAALERALRQRRPERVLLVVPPDVLDVDLHRRVLLLSYGLDDDVFADFVFGWFTARDGDGLRAFWQRTVAALAQERSPAKAQKRWIGTGVTSGIKSTVYPGNIPAVARAAGYEGEQIYWSCIEADPDVLDFVAAKLPELEGADVIGLYGNGDPQGIWLFDDHRNVDRTKHWDYDPKKVGLDPDHAMPRILASQFARLKLKSPVIWSGTCHSAATQRVWVEGDIVSTFGRTNGSTLHQLGPKESLGLALIEAGAVAYLAPIAANHGMSGSMESDFALIHGACLGEVLKSTYDDVALAAGGDVPLELVGADSRSLSRPEYVMQGGGANRLLIGDPALAPFAPTAHPGQTITVTNKTKGAFDVVVRWSEGFQAHSWDMYRNQRGSAIRDRVVARLDLADLAPRGADLVFTATCTATSPQGVAMPYTLTHCVPESFHGRRYLHLQANGNRAVVGRKAVEVRFAVRF